MEDFNQVLILLYSSLHELPTKGKIAIRYWCLVWW